VVIAEEIEINGTLTVEYRYFPQSDAPPGGIPMGITTYLGVAGSRGDGYIGLDGSGNPIYDPFYTQYAGFFNNRSQTSLASVPDGTSNTLMIGECIGNYPAGILNGTSSSNAFMGVGAGLTKYGLATRQQNPSANAFTFSSGHNVVQFVFGDGSVRALNPAGTSPGGATPAGTSITGPLPPGAGPNWLFLQQLAGMGDGQPVPSGILGGN